jgi:hypothetical protein
MTRDKEQSDLATLIATDRPGINQLPECSAIDIRAGWQADFASIIAYLRYNPFKGTALTVKKGGALPVHRSEFFIIPEQLRWMLNDPMTPGHVKMMILLAYTTGLRSEVSGITVERDRI